MKEKLVSAIAIQREETQNTFLIAIVLRFCHRRLLQFLLVQHAGMLPSTFR